MSYRANRPDNLCNRRCLLDRRKGVAEDIDTTVLIPGTGTGDGAAYQNYGNIKDQVFSYIDRIESQGGPVFEK